MAISIRAELDNSYLAIHTDNADLIKALRRATSYFSKDAVFTKTYKSGVWDGRYHLSRKLPSGLLIPAGLKKEVGDTLAKFQNGAYKLSIEDKRKDIKNVKSNMAWNPAIDPRYYQTDSVELAIKEQRGMIDVATGGGKMLVAVMLYYKIGCPTLVLVTSKEAQRDTVKEFEKAIPGIDVAGWDGKKRNLGHVTVATINSLFSNNLKHSKELDEFAKSCGMIIMDEVHGTGAKEYFNIGMRSNARYKFGLSGTTFRPDGRGLYLKATTGEILYKKPAVELQEEGFLVKSKVVFLESLQPETDMFELARLTTQEFYLATIVNNEARNRRVVEIKEMMHDKRTLFITKSVEHGEILSQMLGLEFLHGKTPKKRRKEIQEQLQSGDIQSLVVTVVYDQSVNIPAMEAIVDCSGQSPHIKILQRLGRILRNSEGKDEAIFITFYDDWDPDVLKHSRKRFNIFKKAGQNPKIYTYKEFKNEFASTTIGRKRPNNVQPKRTKKDSRRVAN